MGVILSKPQQKASSLLVGTIRYEVQLQNPFQFCGGSHLDIITKQLSNNFKQIFDEYIASQPKVQNKSTFNILKFFQDIKSIDKKYQPRYTPLYNKNVGIKQKNILMNKQQYEAEWDKSWNRLVEKMGLKEYIIQQKNQNKKQQKPKAENQKKKNLTKQQQQKIKKIQQQLRKIKNLKIFDSLCFQTFLKYFQTQQKQQKKSEEYIKLMNQYFIQEDLKENQKESRIVELLQHDFNQNISQDDSLNIFSRQKKSLDVLFIQQASQGLRKLIKDYQKLQDRKSQFFVHIKERGIIIVRNQQFKNIYTYQQLQIKRIEFEKLQRNILQKQQQKYIQAQQIKKLLQQQQHKLYAHYKQFLQEYFPLQLRKKNAKQTVILLCDDYILMNIDLNKDQQIDNTRSDDLKLALQKLIQTRQSDGRAYQIIVAAQVSSLLGNSNDYNIYPKPTPQTLQKRTYLQTQYTKADSVVTICKDTLITTLKFDKIGTMTINYDKDKKKIQTRTKQYHFDHNLVMGLLNRNNV